MKILIIEDEHFAAERLQSLLAEAVESFEISGILDSVKASVKWFREQPAPDLVFLDIQLADGISFAIFEQVKVQAPVIFTTAFDEYAIQAFEVHSVDYLLKPVDPGKLRNALKKFNELKEIFQKPDLTDLFLSAARSDEPKNL